jgi:hypothetical protein
VDDELRRLTSAAVKRFQLQGQRETLGRKRVYATVVQTADWSPDSSYFFGDVETNLLTSDSVIVRAALTCRGS